jgi:hypothetical protein
MAEPPRERRSIATREEADRFLAAFADTMGELERVLEHETRELSAGRIRSGLSQEERKGALAAGYLQGLEHARANAVAIARLAPEAASRLKEAHHGFRAALERNQAVLATARAVSEGLVKGVAEEMAKRTRPAGYGDAAPPVRATAGPLVYSGRI